MTPAAAPGRAASAHHRRRSPRSPVPPGLALALMTLVSLPAASPAQTVAARPAHARARPDAPPDNPGEPRPVHWSITAGAWGALTGPGPAGPALELELHPGGYFGRLGVSVLGRGPFGGEAGGLVAGGFSWEAGAARPRLVMALHGDAGVALGTRRPVLGGGMKVQWRLWSLFVVAAGVTGHVHVDGVHSRLGLAATLTLGLAR